MLPRPVLVNLRVSAEERAKLAAIAAANDEPLSRTVRRWIATAYRERFGEAPPPASARVQHAARRGRSG